MARRPPVNLQRRAGHLFTVVFTQDALVARQAILRREPGIGEQGELRGAKLVRVNLVRARLVPPHGMAGGEPGTPGRNSVLRTDGSVSPLGPFDQTEMGAGDVFVIESPGGGGYGAVR